MTLPDAPDRLIQPIGLPNFGVFAGAISRLNLSEFDFQSIRRGPLSRSRLLARLYLKRWHYVGVVHPSFFLGAACVHLSYAVNVFAYLYDRRTRELYPFDALLLGSRGVEFAESAIFGKTRGKLHGLDVAFTNEGVPNTVRIRAKDRLFASVSFDPSRVEPLSCVTRIGLGGFNYTHKAAGIPSEGEVEIDGRRYNAAGSWAVVDFTAGVPARETFWNWASGGGRCRSGKVFGINLAAGINETGFTENVFWIDGRIHKVDGVHFDYDRKDVTQAPWRMKSADGRIDLAFAPEGRRAAKFNALVVASAFQQPFGTFSGVLRADDHEETIAEGYGFVEEHYAKW
ncbi:MAG: DUF2804 domain-containing protein [bacterium]